jgi:hypothetical protein
MSSSAAKSNDISSNMEREYQAYRKRFNLSTNILSRLRCLDDRNLTGSELGAITQAQIHNVIPLLKGLKATLPNCYTTQHTELQEQLDCLHAGEVLTSAQFKVNFMNLYDQDVRNFPIGQETLTHADCDCAQEHSPKSLEIANDCCSKLRDIVKNLRGIKTYIGRTSLSLGVTSLLGSDVPAGARRLCTNSIVKSKDNANPEDDNSSYRWELAESFIESDCTNPGGSGQEGSNNLSAHWYKKGLEGPVTDWILKSGMDREHIKELISHLDLVSVPDPGSDSLSNGEVEKQSSLVSLHAVFTELLSSWDTLSREQSVPSDDGRPSSIEGASSMLRTLTHRPSSKNASSDNPSSKRPAGDEEQERLPPKRSRG